jgi:hypothetical protein
MDLRFNDLDDANRFRATQTLRRDIPVIVQHTRLDSRKAEVSLMSTMAYAEG